MSMNTPKRLVIVGGVAGGASAAARARRLSEKSEILVLERGPHVSFANCGLPYFAGGEIPERDDLLVQTPESLKERLNLDVRVNSEVTRLNPATQTVVVKELTTGREYEQPYDALILGLGVKPEARLAREAGLESGELGGIRVNEHLQTSDPHIWAVGDVIEVRDGVTGQWASIPLAGPANRQGRVAADVIFGRASRYNSTWGTAVLRLFQLTAACTGANAKSLRRANIPFEAVHLHPSSHAGYYPGAQPIALKILFDPTNGRLLGAQAVGRDGVDKRIDVLATALMAGLTVHDLAELELAYAPPFGSAKDPVNLAGMVAQNVLSSETSIVQWDEVASLNPATTLLLDVRDPDERAAGFIPGSIHIPLSELRQRLNELPRNRTLVAYCHSGQRSYLATRLLNQLGFKARNLTGAWRTWLAARSQT